MSSIRYLLVLISSFFLCIHCKNHESNDSFTQTKKQQMPQASTIQLPPSAPTLSHTTAQFVWYNGGCFYKKLLQENHNKIEKHSFKWQISEYCSPQTKKLHPQKIDPQVLAQALSRDVEKKWINPRALLAPFEAEAAARAVVWAMSAAQLRHKEKQHGGMCLMFFSLNKSGLAKCTGPMNTPEIFTPLVHMFPYGTTEVAPVTHVTQTSQFIDYIAVGMIETKTKGLFSLVEKNCNDAIKTPVCESP